MRLLEDVTVLAYKAGAITARVLPSPVAGVAGRLAGIGFGAADRGRRRVVERNLERVLGRPLGLVERARLVRLTFESYARYWVEAFRLPDLTPSEVDAAFTYEGLEHIDAALAEGRGLIVALAHLGGWEWAAAWMTGHGYAMSVVVEPLEPPELFEWFKTLREAMGVEVIPLGPAAGSAVVRALKANHVVCLVCDRDIAGNGVEVSLFGERTTMPAGPATLALRTGAPLLPTAVYFDGPTGHHAIVRPPIPVVREGSLRDDVARVTQLVAGELETLIRRAPEQWHLMQPNWPSDRP